MLPVRINLSPHEERFGENIDGESVEEHLYRCIAVIRDQPGTIDLLQEYAPWSSIMSDPGCVLYAIYDALEELKQTREDIKIMVEKLTP